MTKIRNIARREVVQSVAFGLGFGSIGGIGGIRALAGTNGAAHFPIAFSPDESRLLAAVVDTLIPRTDTPGAIDVGVVTFILFMFNRGMQPPEQKTFRDGLQAIMRDSQTLHSGGFSAAAVAQRGAYLGALDTRLNSPTASDLKNPSLEFLAVVKRLTVIGFFTSEMAARNELDVQLFPGAFVGEKPMNAQSRTSYEDAFGVPLERPPGYLAPRG
jgi:hypothetical protein